MSNDKQKKRETEAAEKIAAVLRVMGHEARTDASGSGTTVVRVVDVGMTFEVSESTRGRSGSWLLRERSIDVRETVYCPSTHKDLDDQGMRDVKALVRQVSERRDVMRQNVERIAQIKAASEILGDLRNVRGRGFTRVRAVVDPIDNCTDRVDAESDFTVYVPTERAEDFARLVRGFFDGMKAEADDTMSRPA